MRLRLPLRFGIACIICISCFYVLYVKFPPEYHIERGISVSSMVSKDGKRSLTFIPNRTNQRCNTVTKDCIWQQEQQKRRGKIQHACSVSAQSGGLTNDILKHILVSDDYKVLYCYVPKVACTTWKRILLLLNGKNNTDHVHTAFIPSLANFPIEGVKRRLREYTKFLVVRNPHERLLSAYNEKFMKFNEFAAPFHKHTGPKIRRYNTNYLLKKLMMNFSKTIGKHKKQHLMKLEENNAQISFQDFIRYVGDTSNTLNGGEEVHWRELYRLCSPCSIHYDFIAKFDTMNIDARNILSHIGADNLTSVLNIRPHPTNSSDSNKVRNAFEKVTEEDIVKFETRFKQDMSLFGYQRPAAITRFKSEEKDKKDGLKRLSRLS